MHSQSDIPLTFYSYSASYLSDDSEEDRLPLRWLVLDTNAPSSRNFKKCQKKKLLINGYWTDYPFSPVSFPFLHIPFLFCPNLSSTSCSARDGGAPTFALSERAGRTKERTAGRNVALYN